MCVCVYVGGGYVSLFVSRETGLSLRWFGVVICGLGWFIRGLGLTWQVEGPIFLAGIFFTHWYLCGLKWFGGGFGCFVVVWGVSTDHILF